MMSDIGKMGRVVGCAILVVAGLATSSCTAMSSPSTPTESKANEVALVNLEDLMAKANDINKKDLEDHSLVKQEILASMEARPSLDGPVVRPTTMVIHDAVRASHEPGTYRLVVTCVGEGSIYASFHLGSEAVTEELPPCQAVGTVSSVEMVLTSKAENSDVYIIPVGETEMAMSYRIERNIT